MNHFIPQYIRNIRVRDGMLEAEFATQWIEWLDPDVPDGPYPMLRLRLEWKPLAQLETLPVA